MRRLSRLELTALVVTLAFLFFTAGWFLHATSISHTYVVTTQTPSQSQLSDEPAEDGAADGILEGERISINRADLYDLDRLPGIGAVKAQAILDYRAEHGPFLTVEQLLEVDGIGEVTLNNLLPYITLE